MTPNDKIVEAVARAIDPDCFSDWRRSFDYEMKISGNVDEARRFADWSSGKKIERVKDQARAAITAFQAEAWQPIETAPTNTAIQIHCPDLDYYGNQGVYAGMLVDMGTGKRWMTFGWAIGRDLGPESQPSSWRPLPLPPPQKASP